MRRNRECSWHCWTAGRRSVRVGEGKQCEVFQFECDNFGEGFDCFFLPYAVCDAVGERKGCFSHRICSLHLILINPFCNGRTPHFHRFRLHWPCRTDAGTLRLGCNGILAVNGCCWKVCDCSGENDYICEDLNYEGYG
mgnify:CR=1 FL=1